MIDMNNLESLATEIGKDIKDIRTRFETKEKMHEAVDATEYNSFKENTVHTVDVIRNRLSSAEKALFARPSNPTLSLNDNTLSISGGNSVTLPTHQSEIRGTGMPNGVVEAPIGTTYIDTAKTKGALKWIKTTDGGNQGWKVTEGDTGWVLVWKHDTTKNVINRMYCRRKNDVVHVKFEPKISDSVTTPEVNLILDNGSVSWADTLSIQGFQPVDDILQTIFKKTIDVYSEVYAAENSEDVQGTGAVILHFLYNSDNLKTGLELLIATSQLGVKENHVNPFSYLTEDEWPTTLP